MTANKHYTNNEKLIEQLVMTNALFLKASEIVGILLSSLSKVY